jgi:hypothetical protein
MNATFHFVALALFSLTPILALEGAETPQAGELLSGALSDRIVSIAMGWGELGYDTSVKPAGRPAMKLRIGEKTYEHGLGHHAPGELVVELGGEFKTFETEVGIQWQGGVNTASVVFQVFADGKKVFDSGVLREADAARKVALDVRGAEELRLVATDAGDGITCDCANWAEARLIREPGAARRPASPAVNIARFARVVAWDPAQKQGTKASRIEEMPAGDIFPCVELAPSPGGGYTISPWKAGDSRSPGPASFGLWWYENRFLRGVSLEFEDGAAKPPSEGVRLEVWEGESAWQGSWKAVEAAGDRQGNPWTWILPPSAIPQGTPRIRWVFPAIKEPVAVKKIAAYSRALWRALDVRIEPVPGGKRPSGDVEIYNGEMLGPSGEAASPTLRWDGEKPLDLKVRYSAPRRYKGDRTAICFRLEDTSFAVAVEDLIARDCVYVPHAGVFAKQASCRTTPGEYLKEIAGRKTVLGRVREMPEQTFAQAMEKVHNPVQDLGPMMISLACDNRKFVAHRDGTLAFNLCETPDEEPAAIPDEFSLSARREAAGAASVSRRLCGDWLPVPETTVKHGETKLNVRTCVAPLDEEAPAGAPAWLRRRALGVVEYEVASPGPAPARFSLALALAAKDGAVEWKAAGPRASVEKGGRLVVLVEKAEGAPLTFTPQGATLKIQGEVPAGSPARWAAFVPAWKAAPGDLPPLSPEKLRGAVESYWKRTLESALALEIPDKLLENVIRASQVHCLLAARNEAQGARVSPWISSDRYGPLESEANSIIRGMGFFGHEDFARRSLDFFEHRLSPEGYLTTGYTLIGTGEHLWTLGEHFDVSRDSEWLRRVAPGVARACRWIMENRAKTKRVDARGEKAPEFGLMPPGVTADWGRFAYRFFNEVQYCHGLELAGRALAEIGDPAAPAILADAEKYREDILRAWRWTQGRSAVVLLDSGAWVPSSPAILDCFGNVEDFLPGEDGNRTWAYSIEIGAHHQAVCGILPPRAREVDWIIDYLEDVQFLRTGMGDYPEEKSRADFFNLGGFAKVQPYYGRIAEVHALRDDVKAFLRSYFNAIPSLLSLENLSFWEHFHNTGGWNKTHETGWFLCQSRLLFAMERGEELWLLPFAPRAWFTEGKQIRVSNAPSRFGRTGFAVESGVGQSMIVASIEPPRRNPPKAIVLRLRHPEGKPIRAVEVDGKPHADFDPRLECVRLAPAAGKVRVQVSY